MLRLRLRLLKVLAAAGVLGMMLVACTTVETSPPPDAPVVAAPALKAGNYWEYAVRDGYTGLPHGIYRYTVSRADAGSVTIEVTRDDRLIDTQIYTPDLKG